MDETPQAAKQAARAQPAKAAPQTPSSPQSATAPEKHTDDVQKPLNEKAASPPYVENSTKPNPNIQSEKTQVPPIDQPTGDAPSEVPVVAQPEMRREEQPREEVRSEKANPSSSDTRTGTAVGVGAGAAAGLGAGTLAAAIMAENPNVTIQAPTPTVAEQEDQIISDRTPEQAAMDTDIEMTDVGPTIPLSSNEVTATAEDDTHPATHRESMSQVDLPPPPPLEERQAQMAPHIAPPSEDTSRAPSPAQLQKWLLPPMRQEHKGRKCLILDLDETLVHSSFKVGYHVLTDRGYVC